LVMGSISGRGRRFRVRLLSWSEYICNSMEFMGKQINQMAMKTKNTC
jgi:hypothetical protein